jgi:hypothetical protein
MKGLSHKFTLNNGKFKFSEGKIKANDNLSFFISFFDFNRIYLQSYVFRTMSLIQKPETYLGGIKIVFLNNLKTAINKYVKGFNFIKGDITKLDTKEYAIIVDCKYTSDVNAEDSETIQTVIFT